EIDLERGLDERGVRRIPAGYIQVKGIVEIPLLDGGEEGREPAPARPPIARLRVPEPRARPAQGAGREAPVTALVVVKGEADLLEIVHALSPPGCLPCRLDRREEECDEGPDDGDDDQELDEGEAARTTTLLMSTRAVHGRSLRGDLIPSTESCGV